jgi:hypothetical protein
MVRRSSEKPRHTQSRVIDRCRNHLRSGEESRPRSLNDDEAPSKTYGGPDATRTLDDNKMTMRTTHANLQNVMIKNAFEEAGKKGVHGVWGDNPTNLIHNGAFSHSLHQYLHARQQPNLLYRQQNNDGSISSDILKRNYNHLGKRDTR